MEAVVSLVAVQAQFFVPGQANPVAAGDFSAAAAHIRIKKPGLFRQGEGGFLHREHLLRVAALVVGKGLLPGHFPGFQHQAERFPRFPVVKGEGLLSPYWFNAGQERMTFMSALWSWGKCRKATFLATQSTTIWTALLGIFARPMSLIVPLPIPSRLSRRSRKSLTAP